MYRLHGAIHAYGGTTVSARDTADAVISALTPAAWYRNATGVTSAGGFASQWDDYSGNTRHLVQATGTNQPAYAAGVFTADGADNRMVASTWGGAQPRTVYWVGKQVTWSSDYIFDGTSNVSNLLYQVTSTPTLGVYAGLPGPTSASLAVGTRGIVCAVFNNASSSIRVNDNSAVAGTVGTGSAGGFVLFSGGTAGNWSNATAEEVVVFDAAHNTATQSSVITALNNALTVF